jgi:hypothetical protein
MYTPNSNNLNHNNITHRLPPSSSRRLNELDERDDMNMSNILLQAERERMRLAQSQQEYIREQNQNQSQQLQQFQQQPQLPQQNIRQPISQIPVPTQAIPSSIVISDKHCQKPGNFDGTDGANAREFLNGLFIYFHATDIPQSKRAAVAASYLKGSALNWVTERTKQIINNNIVDSWQQFESDFIKRYDPVSAETKARYSLSSLKLGTAPILTIDQYINKFDECLVHLSTMDERTKIHYFEDGLPQNVRIHFATNTTRATSYVELRDRVSEYYTIIQTINIKDSSKTTNLNLLESSETQTTISSNTPNDSVASVAQQLFAFIQQQQQQQQQRSYPRSFKPRNNDKDNLYCTNCKQPRHTVETCWQLHPEQKPPRIKNFNNSHNAKQSSNPSKK